MFLRPQHFQQQERYLEFYANARSGPLGSHAWGYEQLALDADALTFRLRAGAEASYGHFSLLAEAEGTAALIDDYEQTIEKWRGRSKEIGRDIDKFTEVLNREIYSKIDLNKL